MADDLDTNAGAAPAERATDETAASLERREALRRFGAYAACAAPVLTVLMASRQSQAGGFSRNGNSSRNGGGSGPISGGGGCGFSC